MFYPEEEKYKKWLNHTWKLILLTGTKGKNFIVVRVFHELKQITERGNGIISPGDI